MTLAEKIVDQLISQGVGWPGGPSNARIVRTRAGRHQRACGAWSWFLRPVDDSVAQDGEFFPNVGSQCPASEVARGFTVDDGGYQRRQLGQLTLDPIEK